MSSELSEQEHLLRHEVESSERVLDDLERDLRAVNVQLEALAEKDQQYKLLSDICRSLEELDSLGAAPLFWDTQEGGGHAERVSYARRNIDEYGNKVARVEEKRQSIIDKIGSQNSRLDVLHYDLSDILEEEENRNNEWLPEREPSDLPARVQVMPWARGAEEDQRLRRSLAMSMAASIALAMLLSMVALPLIEGPEKAELPERVAKLVRQERLTPPPPPAAKPDLPEPEPELVDEAKPETIPEVSETPALANVEQPNTREQVKSKGILAFRDSFASRADYRPAAHIGSDARLSNVGADAVGRPERMMVTTSAPGSSGGINLADISRDFGGGGGGIEGVELTRVASSIGGATGSDRPMSGGAFAGRTDEEIQIVFDRYKASLYRLYNRELRKDPTLRGQLVLQLTIEPDGSVSLCQLHSSNMEAVLLANQVVDRVRTFDFGAKEDIVAVTIIYPIDFLPAA